MLDQIFAFLFFFAPCYLGWPIFVWLWRWTRFWCKAVGVPVNGASHWVAVASMCLIIIWGVLALTLVLKHVFPDAGSSMLIRLAGVTGFLTGILLPGIEARYRKRSLKASKKSGI